MVAWLYTLKQKSLSCYKHVAEKRGLFHDRAWLEIRRHKRPRTKFQRFNLSDYLFQWNSPILMFSSLPKTIPLAGTLDFNIWKPEEYYWPEPCNYFNCSFPTWHSLMVMALNNTLSWCSASFHSCHLFLLKVHSVFYSCTSKHLLNSQKSLLFHRCLDSNIYYEYLK